MFGQYEDDVFEMTNALDALGDLEQNTSDAIIAQRSSKRIDMHTQVSIRPGNSSQRQQFVIKGMTSDISNGGTKLLLPCPITPGDVYWISFDDPQTHIGSLFARCRRCIMINEDAFEVGLRFFNDIDLSSALATASATSEH